MTEPEEGQEKTRKTDQVLYSPDGDPHHNPAQAPRPDRHGPVTVTRGDETEIVEDEQ